MKAFEARPFSVLAIACGAAAAQAGTFTVVRAAPDPNIVTNGAIRNQIESTGFPWIIRDSSTGIDFVLIPAGTFTMGSDPSDPEATSDEMPAHQVTLTKAFYIGRTEVTQAQWFAMTGQSPSYFGNQPNNPVERVNWTSAVSAGAARHYRLPTEAEWEFACRGGSAAARYAALNSIAWWGNGSGGTSGWGTNPVATKAPNGFGTYDMIGNVWEYCSDLFGPYTADAQIDPTGPNAGTEIVARSGDWYWPALGNRAPFRGHCAADSVGLASNGIRYALSTSDSGFAVDCNNDGIADYGQIARGDLSDENTNGVPDICESSVTGVVPPSVPAQGGATVTIRGNNFLQTPAVLIGGVPATNVERLSATRITATSPALLPGMTSVTVNGFTLPDAIYVRPECGSDLDQNGVVDTADISIILLDFGPCYQAPLAAPAPEVPPLLAAQALPGAPRQR